MWCEGGWQAEATIIVTAEWADGTTHCATEGVDAQAVVEERDCEILEP